MTELFLYPLDFSMRDIIISCHFLRTSIHSQLSIELLYMVVQCVIIRSACKASVYGDLVPT